MVRQVLTIAEIVIHEYYDAPTHAYDIALVKVLNKQPTL